MMALSGVPLVFCGFWSKDEILHVAWLYQPSKIPFFLGLGGAFLTAFYMTRQMCFVFAGKYRGGHETAHDDHGHSHSHGDAHAHDPHESPAVMTLPLQILAACTVLLTLVSTPLWPWLPEYLVGEAAHWSPTNSSTPARSLLVVSGVVVAGGIGLGWWFYGCCRRRSSMRRTRWSSSSRAVRVAREVLRMSLAATFVKWNARLGQLCHDLDRRVDLLVSPSAGPRPAARTSRSSLMSS